MNMKKLRMGITCLNLSFMVGDFLVMLITKNLLPLGSMFIIGWMLWKFYKPELKELKSRPKGGGPNG